MPKQASTAKRTTITIGRARFEKICAVEGIKLTEAMKKRFAEFDRKELPRPSAAGKSSRSTARVNHQRVHRWTDHPSIELVRRQINRQNNRQF